MKFSSKETKLTSSQKTMAIELGLADQKKAIELLYSQYSNPIQTCVQELVSNAFDAHRAANNEHIPVKITLPNALNDFYFSVRDFGNSMDDDTIKNVYMRVNASTKSNNNNAIGGFGIGSKTPWAYTDTFILKTFLNGLETQYALVKGRSSVSVVYQGKTEEENGVEVIFKTKERDKAKFEEAVRRISLCAKVKPLVNANIKLDFDHVDRLSPLVRLVKTDLLEKTIYANIGGVLYRLGSEFIENSDPNYWSRRVTANRQIYNILRDCSLIIDLPVGAIMPLQTREGLFKGGEEGQQNKAVMKKVFSYALKVIESTLEAREKQVISPKLAIEYFSGGMLRSQKSFKFGSLTISGNGLDFLHGGVATILTRKSTRGWNSTIKTVKKSNPSGLSFRDLEKPVYFSELSPNKARLSNRFRRICASTDVIVLEKHNFKDLEVYNFLKENCNATNIEEVEVEKTTSANKGVKIDKKEVVIYYLDGTKRFTFRTDKSASDWTTKPIIVVPKGEYTYYPTDVIKKLGFEVWAVAPTNMQKLLDLGPKFMKEKEAIQLFSIKELYVNDKVKSILDRIEAKNLDYIIKLASPTKQTLFRPVGDSYNFHYRDDITEELKKAYGRQLDEEVKKAVKDRLRVIRLAEKAPLAQHIRYPSSLKGKARYDLDKYIISSLEGEL